VRVGYMLDLWSTNVRRGDQEGKCGAGRRHEEGTINE
jgi:hypothetical protein